MIEFQNNNWEDILKIFVAVGYFKKKSEGLSLRSVLWIYEVHAGAEI